MIIGVLGYLVANHIGHPKASGTNASFSKSPKTDNETTFSGTVTSDKCVKSTIPIGDVGCSITVNDNTVIEVVPGNAVRSQPWGKFEVANVGSNNIAGRKVVVFAHKINSTLYTLEGSASYYVKLYE